MSYLPDICVYVYIYIIGFFLFLLFFCSALHIYVIRIHICCCMYVNIISIDMHLSDKAPQNPCAIRGREPRQQHQEIPGEQTHPLLRRTTDIYNRIYTYICIAYIIYHISYIYIFMLRFQCHRCFVVFLFSDDCWGRTRCQVDMYIEKKNAGMPSDCWHPGTNFDVHSAMPRRGFSRSPSWKAVF